MLVVFLFYFLLTCGILWFLAYRFPLKAYALFEKITGRTEIIPGNDYGYVVDSDGEYCFTRDNFIHYPQLQNIYPVSLKPVRIIVENDELGVKVDFYLAPKMDLASLKDQVVQHGGKMLDSSHEVATFFYPVLVEHVKTAIKEGKDLEDKELEGFEISEVKKVIIQAS